jgi:RNA polymerase sigma factor (sigma-70 family)
MPRARPADQVELKAWFLERLGDRPEVGDLVREVEQERGENRRSESEARNLVLDRFLARREGEFYETAAGMGVPETRWKALWNIARTDIPNQDGTFEAWCRSTIEASIREDDDEDELRSLDQRFRMGDESAFDALYYALNGRALAYAKRQLSSSNLGIEAEDVMQEAWKRYVKARPRDQDGIKDPRSYLNTTIRRTIVDLARARRGVLKTDSLDATSGDTDDEKCAFKECFAATDSRPSENLESLEYAELSMDLENAIEALPQEQRNVVALRFARDQGLDSWDLIGERLGITRYIAQRQFENAARAIRAWLVTERGWDPFEIHRALARRNS